MKRAIVQIMMCIMSVIMMNASIDAKYYKHQNEKHEFAAKEYRQQLEELSVKYADTAKELKDANRELENLKEKFDIIFLRMIEAEEKLGIHNKQ